MFSKTIEKKKEISNSTSDESLATLLNAKTVKFDTVLHIL